MTALAVDRTEGSGYLRIMQEAADELATYFNEPRRLVLMRPGVRYASRKCGFCNKTFVPKEPEHEGCTVECRARIYRRKRRAEAKDARDIKRMEQVRSRVKLCVVCHEPIVKRTSVRQKAHPACAVASKKARDNANKRSRKAALCATRQAVTLPSPVGV